jgi:hypothetical protein
MLIFPLVNGCCRGLYDAPTAPVVYTHIAAIVTLIECKKFLRILAISTTMSLCYGPNGLIIKVEVYSFLSQILL